MITDPLCQLCLEPEGKPKGQTTGDKSLHFVRNICHCAKDGRGNLHRRCLVEWTTKSGAKGCRRCGARYDSGGGNGSVTFVPRSLPDYLLNCHEEWVKLAHKVLRELNSLHILLLVLYTLLFVPLPSCCWLPYKAILSALAAASLYANLQSVALFGRQLLRNYRRWKLSYFTVVFEEEEDD